MTSLCCARNSAASTCSRVCPGVGDAYGSTPATSAPRSSLCVLPGARVLQEGALLSGSERICRAPAKTTTDDCAVLIQSKPTLQLEFAHQLLAQLLFLEFVDRASTKPVFLARSLKLAKLLQRTHPTPCAMSWASPISACRNGGGPRHWPPPRSAPQAPLASAPPW